MLRGFGWLMPAHFHFCPLATLNQLSVSFFQSYRERSMILTSARYARREDRGRYHWAIGVTELQDKAFATVLND